jgi:hypothetical protein
MIAPRIVTVVITFSGTCMPEGRMDCRSCCWDSRIRRKELWARRGKTRVLFNAFNHPNFGAPSATVLAPATFGKIFAAGPAREIQFGLKYYW